MAGIKKQSLVDQVYDRLRTEIISLQRPLGGRLNVSELQTQLEVSCTPIREAVNRLQQEGLVVYETNVGARILSLDAHDVEEIQQLALTLHHAAIRLSMERGDRAAMAEELKKHLEARRKGKTPQSKVTAVNQFLGVFYHNSGNRRLDRSMISIQGQQLLLRYIYAQNSPPENEHRDLEDLGRILEQVQAGDTEGICATLSHYTARMEPILTDYTARLGGN